MASHIDNDVSSSDSDSLIIPDIKAQIRTSLESLKCFGSFASFGQIDILADPHIDIDGLGRIELPLTGESAQSLISACHQSPFGKGAKTVIDTSVRRTWELNNDQFHLSNPHWKTQLDHILVKALGELGLEDSEIHDTEAQLYKMLLYEKGAMFKAHKDSEKVPGMFGTLVIALPSAHNGGVVKVRHAKQSRSYATESCSSSYVCWYSDVTHEVTEVTSGYRWVLTYNLVNKSRGKTQLSATKVRRDLQELHAAFKTWQKSWRNCAGNLGHDMFIHTLSHTYTDASLRLRNLNLKDSVAASALQDVCRDTDCTLFLASCEREVQGGCEEYDDYSHAFSEEDEDSENDESEQENSYVSHRPFGDYHDITEVCHDTLTLKRVVDSNGVRVAEELSIDEEDFIEDSPFDDRAPDDEDFSGFTGNEGVSATHWYRDTVAIVVPNDFVPEFLLKPFTQHDNTRYYLPKPKFGVENLLRYLRTQQELDRADKLKNRHLDAVCRMILKKHQNHVFKNVFSKEAIHQIVEGSAELGNLDLLQTALGEISGPLPTNLYSKIGILMKTTGFEGFQLVINAGLSLAKAIHERYSAIVALQTALIDEETAPPSEVLKQKLDWLDLKIDELLDDQQTSSICRDLVPEDGKALVQILNIPGKLEHYQARVVNMAVRNKRQTAFMVELLSNLFSPIQERLLPKEKAVMIFTPLLQALILAFNLKPRNEWLTSDASHLNYSTHNFVWPYAQHTPAIKPVIAPVEGEALARLFDTIFSLGLRGEASQLLNHVCREAEVLDAKYFPAMFLPFLQSMVPVWSAQGIEYNDPICLSLYQPVLRSCLLRYVGQRPLAPAHWSQKPVSCRCHDCMLLNRFLTDPVQSVGYFPMGKERRAHLHSQLDRTECTHITQRTGNPHTLVVTKGRPEYQTLETGWRNRLKEYAAGTTGKIKSPVLRQLLGNKFHELTSVALVDGSLPPTGPLTSAAGNSRQSAVPGSGGMPKQVAGTKRKAVEIIDLT